MFGTRLAQNIEAIHVRKLKIEKHYLRLPLRIAASALAPVDTLSTLKFSARR